jgi:hypothetical protein
LKGKLDRASDGDLFGRRTLQCTNINPGEKEARESR